MQSLFVVHDPDFKAVLGDDARLEHVVDVDAHEGPVYVADEHAIYFTTLPRVGVVAIKRVLLADMRVEVFLANANRANGMTLDVEGELVVYEQGTLNSRARISRIDRFTGERVNVVDSWRGMRLNSPNDVVVKRDGTVWFTDPSYGDLQGFRPEPEVGDYVYRFDPATGRVTVVADDFYKPNGIAFSPDERVLYVTDSGANQEPASYYPALPHHIVAFDVVGGRHLRNRRLFAVVVPGFPDGLKVDADGHVYASSDSGVQVFSPEGDLIGEIELPGTVNFTFGGPDRNVLYITTDDAIWAATLEAKGT